MIHHRVEDEPGPWMLYYASLLDFDINLLELQTELEQQFGEQLTLSESESESGDLPSLEDLPTHSLSDSVEDPPPELIEEIQEEEVGHIVPSQNYYITPIVQINEIASSSASEGSYSLEEQEESQGLEACAGPGDRDIEKSSQKSWSPDVSFNYYETFVEPYLSTESESELELDFPETFIHWPLKEIQKEKDKQAEDSED